MKSCEIESIIQEFSATIGDTLSFSDLYKKFDEQVKLGETANYSLFHERVPYLKTSSLSVEGKIMGVQLDIFRKHSKLQQYENTMIIIQLAYLNEIFVSCFTHPYLVLDHVDKLISTDSLHTLNLHSLTYQPGFDINKKSLFYLPAFTFCYNQILFHLLKTLYIHCNIQYPTKSEMIVPPTSPTSLSLLLCKGVLKSLIMCSIFKKLIKMNIAVQMVDLGKQSSSTENKGSDSKLMETMFFLKGVENGVGGSKIPGESIGNFLINILKILPPSNTSPELQEQAFMKATIDPLLYADIFDQIGKKFLEDLPLMINKDLLIQPIVTQQQQNSDVNNNLNKSIIEAIANIPAAHLAENLLLIHSGPLEYFGVYRNPKKQESITKDWLLQQFDMKSKMMIKGVVDGRGGWESCQILQCSRCSNFTVCASKKEVGEKRKREEEVGTKVFSNFGCNAAAEYMEEMPFNGYFDAFCICGGKWKEI